MRIKDNDAYLDGEDSIPWQHKVHKIGTRRRRSKQFAEDLIDPRDLPAGVFKPNYTGSRHELHWILTYLSPFYEEGQILDVLRRVKGGKEANVYGCRAHPSMGVDLLAAKLYRPRMFRNLRNDAQYRQGRAVLDERGRAVHDPRRLHAIQRGTALGKELVHTSWLTHEFQTLRLLHGAGADVPQPIAVSQHVILMEYRGDEQRGAPTLNQVTLGPVEAGSLFDRLMRDIDLMLAGGRVHGDLSAYNVLYWSRESRSSASPRPSTRFATPMPMHCLLATWSASASTLPATGSRSTRGSGHGRSGPAIFLCLGRGCRSRPHDRARLRSSRASSTVRHSATQRGMSLNQGALEWLGVRHADES